MKDYFNTNNESGEDLSSSRGKAMSQQDFILDSIRSHPTRTFSPHDLEWLCPDSPITSIRRAISNLTEAGYLEKTDKMVMGPYGKKVHTWRLKTKDGQLTLL